MSFLKLCFIFKFVVAQIVRLICLSIEGQSFAFDFYIPQVKAMGI